MAPPPGSGRAAHEDGHDRARIQIAGRPGYNRIPLIAEAFADLRRPSRST